MASLLLLLLLLPARALITLPRASRPLLMNTDSVGMCEVVYEVHVCREVNVHVHVIYIPVRTVYIMCVYLKFNMLLKLLCTL